MLNYVNTLWSYLYIITYMFFFCLCSIVRNVKYCEAIQAFHILDDDHQSKNSHTVA